jgi:hypothetical protein
MNSWNVIYLFEKKPDFVKASAFYAYRNHELVYLFRDTQ